jgi:flagellar protein FlaF
MQHGAARYRKASQATLPARETEIAAFAAVTRALQAATAGPTRIQALGRNHELWSLLARDLALDSNRLPADLKANLISLALWSMRYSTMAILQDLPMAPLIEVNGNITEGLQLQAAHMPAGAVFTSGTATA